MTKQLYPVTTSLHPQLEKALAGYPSFKALLETYSPITIYDAIYGHHSHMDLLDGKESDFVKVHKYCCSLQFGLYQIDNLTTKERNKDISKDLKVIIEDIIPLENPFEVMSNITYMLWLDLKCSGACDDEQKKVFREALTAILSDLRQYYHLENKRA